MITLTDYLTYLNSQFVDARRQADLAAIATARAYAEDEYLQHFKVPRFTMPVIKLKVPIKIDAVNQETRYDFELNEKDFLGLINKRFQLLMRQYETKLRPFDRDHFGSRLLQEYFRELDQLDGGFVRDVDHALDYDRVATIYDKLFPPNHPNGNPEFPKQLQLALRQALFDAFKQQFRPTITNINNLAVTPQASGLAADDSEKLLLQLDLEMVEESIQLRKITDENGNVIEEILVD
ncbi:MAG: hypothetical protein AAFZ52_10910 [Bacteroidota bacterium]